MNRIFLSTALIAEISLLGILHGADPEPGVKALQPGVQFTLVAEHPDLATPTGVDVDEDGRVWLVACHTHMPGEDYAGPEKDEILIFDREGNRSVFYNQTHHTMDLELGPDGWVYLAERDRIFRIKDSDGNGTADVEEDLAVLTTEADYPHNGLSGLGWHSDGDLVFGLGENFAKGWTLTGKKGEEITGVGEGGVFRCRADGTGLQRVARGMWNPFGLCVRSDGEIFVTDNDPGERPPCRLLHIVPDGDYGYQRIYGGEAHHPFVCWNGELRGSLPMVHPTGEAPCGVVPFRGGLLIPSWSDHRIDFFPLHREGASFGASRIQLVQGERYFRPTCIAEDPSPQDAGTRTWYLTDWVDGRYQVHGYGRLWRLEVSLKEATGWTGPDELELPNKAAVLADKLRKEGESWERSELMKLIEGDDPFLARAALVALSRQARDRSFEDGFNSLSDNERANAVVALKISEADQKSWVPQLLEDESPEVVFETLRWISDAQAKEFLPLIDVFLNRSELSFEVFEAAVATWNSLSGTPENGVRNPEKLLARVQDSDSSARLRAYALRLLPTRANTVSESDPLARIRLPKGLTIVLLKELLAIGDDELSLEVVRVLGGLPRYGSPVLIQVAQDEKQNIDLRAEAISGLSASAGDFVGELVTLAGSDDLSVREESLRALRGVSLSEEQQTMIVDQAKRFPESAELFAILVNPAALGQGRPGLDDVAGWETRIAAVEGEADTEAGRRIFHHASVALCANCHRHDGRGNIVGPDLSSVGDRKDRRWLLESILRPGLEIAPEYLPRMVTLKDGTTATGIRLRSWVREQLRDANGHTLTFDVGEVASIQELTTSFMPPGLVYSLTDRELRDLLAFLESGKAMGEP